jgi:hypothetical protein
MRNKSQRNQSETVRRKRWTVITKAYEYGKFPGVYIALLISYNGQYTIYYSKRNWLLLIEEIVSRTLSKTERIKANSTIVVDISVPNQSASIRY